MKRAARLLPFSILAALGSLSSLALAPSAGFAQTNRPSPVPQTAPAPLSQTYDKIEYRIPMRDGVALYTAVYVPKNKPGKHPILMERTPYGAGPYGPTAFRARFRGSKRLIDDGFVFVYQDVRGMGQSGGKFENVRPQLATGAAGASRAADIDESTDTYDTVDFLVKNVPNNNGRVGLWGISYPGFYAGVGAIHTHPALKAVSPQAPVADWFVGDDFHHNGALMLMDAVRFARFGQSVGRAGTMVGFTGGASGDAFQNFLQLGPLSAITAKFFSDTDGMWAHLMAHPNYDDFWQARSLPDKMNDVTCAVLTVGGWYDAEDCWGALNVYKFTEKQNPKIVNALVMGPWYHGQWSSGNGTKLGDIDFGRNTSTDYQETIEYPFFERFLLGRGSAKVPEARVFETGTNVWRTFSAWPPKESKPAAIYFAEGKSLAFSPPAAGSDSYVSDPANPVPYQKGTIRTRTTTYMLDDQRFVSDRADVLSYQTPTLEKPFTIAGPIGADIAIETDATDVDLVVKVIDVFPPDAPGEMANYQRLVRAEVFRARFRHSFQNPSPLTPGKPERIAFTLPDILHTFPAGHKILVQVQSSWFPLVDRNPQTFVNTATATPDDFKKATVKLIRGDSKLTVRTLDPGR